MRGGQKVTDPNAEDVRQALDKFTTDLTARAEQGKLDPVIGSEMMKYGGPSKCCNAALKITQYLIGEPGVGKTAIAEGLAQRIINSVKCQKG